MNIELKRSSNRMQRPEASEYAPNYAGYIQQVPEGDLLQILSNQLGKLELVFQSVDDQKGTFRYAPGKWSIKEVIGHITDTERVMSYRLLRIARGDSTTSLPGFDENQFVEGASFDRRTVQQLLFEMKAVRTATLALIEGLEEEVWTRRGLTSGIEVSARALAYIIAGHWVHHLQIIEERYLSALS
jgi:hypothetical protein